MGVLRGGKSVNRENRRSLDKKRIIGLENIEENPRNIKYMSQLRSGAQGFMSGCRLIRSNFSKLMSKMSTLSSMLLISV